jgi:hypothetical protein
MRAVILGVICNLWFAASSYGLYPVRYSGSAFEKAAGNSLKTSNGVYGHITRDTTWADTVLMTGDVVVDSGVTLTILPGTVVKPIKPTEWDVSISPWSDGLCDLIISNGNLVAIGTSSDSITFVDNPDSGDVGVPLWDGIQLRGKSSCAICFANLSRAPSAIHCYTDGECNGVLIKNCSIKNCWWTGVSINVVKAKLIVIENNNINHIAPTNAASIWGISGGGIGCGAHGVWIDTVHIKGQIDSLIIKNNDIHRCIGTTLPVAGHSFRNYEMQMGGGSGTGISCNGVKDCIIENNSISSCYGGYGRGELPGESQSGSAYGVAVVSENALIEGNHISNIEGAGDNPATQAIELSGDGIGLSITQDTIGFIKIAKNKIIGCSGERGIGLLCKKLANHIVGGSPESQNDFYGNSTYNLANYTPNDIIATYNWWGTTNRDTIEKYIFDKADSSILGRVLYDPWANKPLGVGDRVKVKGEMIKLTAFPNPFSRELKISSENRGTSSEGVNSGGNTLMIYDPTGRLVRSFYLTPHTSLLTTTGVLWDGRDNAGRRLPAGVYFIRLVAGSRTKTQPVILVR